MNLTMEQDVSQLISYCHVPLSCHFYFTDPFFLKLLTDVFLYSYCKLIIIVLRVRVDQRRLDCHDLSFREVFDKVVLTKEWLPAFRIIEFVAYYSWIIKVLYVSPYVVLTHNASY
jgi:hypothetical protein